MSKRSGWYNRMLGLDLSSLSGRHYLRVSHMAEGFLVEKISISQLHSKVWAFTIYPLFSLCSSPSESE